MDSENIELKNIPQNQEQISLVKVAKEVNRPKQIFNFEQGLNLDSESPKPIKNKRDENDLNSKQNNLERILNNFFSDKMNDMKDELHEHANKFHIDIIQKIHEVGNALTMANEQAT